MFVFVQAILASLDSQVRLADRGPLDHSEILAFQGNQDRLVGLDGPDHLASTVGLVHVVQ